MDSVEHSRRDLRVFRTELREELGDLHGRERVGIDDDRPDLALPEELHRGRVGMELEADRGRGVLEELDAASSVAREEVDAERRVAPEFVEQLLPDVLAVEVHERLQERHANLEEVERRDLGGERRSVQRAVGISGVGAIATSTGSTGGTAGGLSLWATLLPLRSCGIGAEGRREPSAGNQFAQRDRKRLALSRAAGDSGCESRWSCRCRA